MIHKIRNKPLAITVAILLTVGSGASFAQAVPGVTDKTITVLTSDHGDMMSAHGLLGKRFMFDQSAGVPYVVRMPGQQKSLHVAQPISHIDFAPTILDLLGKTPDPQCVGKSRAALVRGETMSPEPVFIE